MHVVVRAAVAAAAVLLCASPCSAVINDYDMVPLSNNFLLYRLNAMYSLADSPAATSEPQAVIEVALDVFFPEGASEAERVQVRVMPEAEFGLLGHVLEGSDERAYCCTERLAAASNPMCSDPGSLIVEGDAISLQMQAWDVLVVPDGDSSRIKERFEVPEKGFYYLVVSFCSETPSEVHISGRTRWINPYGFLPGEVYGYLPFYTYMSFLYLAVGLVFAVASYRHFTELFALQYCMTVVLACALIETYLRELDFYTLNKDGVRSKPVLLAGIFFLVAKKLLSRLLVLVVSMGWGVLKPTLGDDVNRITLLGAAYFVFAYIHLTVENLNHSKTTFTMGAYILVLPVIAADVAFFLWTFTSLNGIMRSLEARNQETKLTLYRALRRILVGCGVVAVTWSVVFWYCIFTGWTTTHWEISYRLEAFWDVFYFFLLLAIIWLWKPSQNGNRYAYNRVKVHEDDDEAYGDDLEDVVANKGSSNGNGNGIARA